MIAKHQLVQRIHRSVVSHVAAQAGQSGLRIVQGRLLARIECEGAVLCESMETVQVAIEIRKARHDDQPESGRVRSQASRATTEANRLGLADVPAPACIAPQKSALNESTSARAPGKPLIISISVYPIYLRPLCQVQPGTCLGGSELCANLFSVMFGTVVAYESE